MFNALDNYIASLNPTCWLNSQHVNGYGVAQPEIDDSITQWTDISGNSNHFVHEIVSGQNAPKFNTSGIYENTHYSLSFLASDKTGLWAGSSNTLWSDKYTFILVFSASNASYILALNFSGSNPGSLAVNPSTNIISSYDSSAVQLSIEKHQRTKSSTIIVKRDLSQFTGQGITSTNNYLKGSRKDISTSSQSSNGLSLGYRRRNGTLDDSFTTGDIYEFITWDRVLNELETARVQSYIKTKYNI